MRSLSPAAKKAIFGQQTDEVFLVLLTITQVGLDGPLHFVNNATDIDSRDQDPDEDPTPPGEPRTGPVRHFLGFPFQLALPDETDNAPARATLQIDNVSPEILIGLRALTDPPLVRLEVVLASQPDVLEAGPFDFALRNANYNANVVQGELAYEDLLNAQFPGGGGFVPSLFPGLW